MNRPSDRMELIKEIEILNGIQDCLRADAMDPMLTWEERLDFNKAVEAIQERINALQSNLQKVS